MYIYIIAYIYIYIYKYIYNHFCVNSRITTLSWDSMSGSLVSEFCMKMAPTCKSMSLLYYVTCMHKIPNTNTNTNAHPNKNTNAGTTRRVAPNTNTNTNKQE